MRPRSGQTIWKVLVLCKEHYDLQDLPKLREQLISVRIGSNRDCWACKLVMSELQGLQNRHPTLDDLPDMRR